eukprot:3761548-Alexandrium_andersonii.AAC.1
MPRRRTPWRRAQARSRQAMLLRAASPQNFDQKVRPLLRPSGFRVESEDSQSSCPQPPARGCPRLRYL